MSFDASIRSINQQLDQLYAANPQNVKEADEKLSKITSEFASLLEQNHTIDLGGMLATQNVMNRITDFSHNIRDNTLYGALSAKIKETMKVQA